MLIVCPAVPVPSIPMAATLVMPSPAVPVSDADARETVGAVGVDESTTTLRDVLALPIFPA